MATIGTILIQAANQAGNLSGGGQPSQAGMGSAGGGEGVRDLKHQKLVEKQGAESNEQGAKAPKFWTAAFKKMGIQMGLAGILKQSQIFTSTIGSLFQIFGAFVDVILAPFVPMFIPMIRWLARQLPTVAKAAQWTADKIYKGVTAVWNFLFSGKIWKNVGGWIKDLVTGIWDKLSDPLGTLTDFVTGFGSKIMDWFINPIKTVGKAIMQYLWNNTLGGSTINALVWKYKFPTWGGGDQTSKTHRMPGSENSPMGNMYSTETYIGDKLLSVEDLTTIEGRYTPNKKVQDWLINAGKEKEAEKLRKDSNKGDLNGGSDGSWWNKIFSKDTWSGAFGDLTTEFKKFFSGGAIQDVLTAVGITVGGSVGVAALGKGIGVFGNAMKAAVWSPKQLVNLLNAAAKTPGMMGLNTAKWAVSQLNMTKGAPSVVGTLRGLGLSEGATDLARRALGTMGGGVKNATLDAWQRITQPVQDARDLASKLANKVRGVTPPVTPTGSNSGWGAFGDSGQDLGGQARTPIMGDDLAQVGGKPNKLSRAVEAFNQWVKKTGRGLGSAAKGGANVFKGVFDEGLSLADDVVKLAKVTPGMGFVGGVVSIGFKKVIPGIAGMYMVGETVADLWRMAKSDTPWLGDWKSLEAWKDEGLGALFAKGEGLGGMRGAGALGMPVEAIGNIQSMFGFGTSISDWQKQITKNQQEGGVLSEGKLMDMIIRGTTGFGGAALSTFFPGLGTLAGGALYEGGRYATTGLNIPGVGQVGGDLDKYGPARDFSDLIIQAIKDGFSSGVPLVEIQ